MFPAVLFVAATLAPFVAAQANSTDSVGVQVEAIQAHFSNAGLVPSLLTTFSPEAVLDLSFSGVGDVSPGAALTQDQVKPTPSLSVQPANSSVKFDGNFTLTMVDADVVGKDESQGQTRHWLVNGVTISGTNVSTDSATAITKYGGPAPAQGSGAHRYVILLYTQPSDFSPPSNLSTPDVPISVFNLNDYVSTSKLGPLVAATYFTVEEGTATASVSATSAVVTSTLAPVASGSGSGSASSPSASAGTNGALGSAKAGTGALGFVAAVFAGLAVL